MSERVLIDGGVRTGRKLQFEHVFRKAIAEGKEVITGPRNGVWFGVSINDADEIVYWPHPKRPEGV